MEYCSLITEDFVHLETPEEQQNNSLHQLFLISGGAEKKLELDREAVKNFYQYLYPFNNYFE